MNSRRVGVTRRRLLLGLALMPFAAGAAETTSHFFALNAGHLKSELAEARAEGRQAVMLFFEQEGCPGCRHMKQNIFNRLDVQHYYGRHFMNLAIDIHSAVPLRDFAGRESTEKAYAQALKIRMTPTFVFYDLSGAEIVRIAGPVQTPEEFLLLGHFVTSGAYKSRSFARFKLDQPKLKGS